jgi:hypothetical protein
MAVAFRSLARQAARDGGGAASPPGSLDQDQAPAAGGPRSSLAQPLVRAVRLLRNVPNHGSRTG